MGAFIVFREISMIVFEHFSIGAHSIGAKFSTESYLEVRPLISSYTAGSRQLYFIIVTDEITSRVPGGATRANYWKLYATTITTINISTYGPMIELQSGTTRSD
jgi:hypothetical protein